MHTIGKQALGRRLTSAILCGVTLSCTLHDNINTSTSGYSTRYGVIDLSLSYLGVSGTDTLYFTDISGLALDAAGNIYVSDAGENRIARFSSLGEFDAIAGEDGQGPGDLNRPCCIALDSAGFLWVEDEGNRRYSKFVTVGGRLTFGTSVAMPAQPSGRRDRITWGPHGELVHVSLAVSPTPPRLRLVRLFLNQAGEVTFGDTLPEPPVDSLRVVTITRRRESSSGFTDVVQPFGPVSLHAIGPEGRMASAVSSRYAVRIEDKSVGVVGQVERALLGPEVSEAEARDARRLLAELTQRLGVPRSTVPFGVPDRKAPIQQLGLDIDDRLWVQHSRSFDAPNAADIYSTHGELVGAAEWPASVEFVGWVIRGNVGLGVHTDSLGRQQVVRIRFN